MLKPACYVQPLEDAIVTLGCRLIVNTVVWGKLHERMHVLRTKAMQIFHIVGKNRFNWHTSIDRVFVKVGPPPTLPDIPPPQERDERPRDPKMTRWSRKLEFLMELLVRIRAVLERVR